MKRMSDEINEILYYYDPVGLAAIHCPEDEYESEAGTIVYYLKDVTNKTDLRWMIYEVFYWWFNGSGMLPSSHRYYRYMAEEIWELWHEVIAESEAEARGEVKKPKDERKKITKETFHKSVMEILYEHDPLTIIKFGVPDDEYTSEAADIISHLPNVSDIRSLKWVVYEIFRKYFSTETIAPYGDERYQRITEEVWDLWQESVEEYSEKGKLYA